MLLTLKVKLVYWLMYKSLTECAISSIKVLKKRYCVVVFGSHFSGEYSFLWAASHLVPAFLLGFSGHLLTKQISICL